MPNPISDQELNIRINILLRMYIYIVLFCYAKSRYSNTCVKRLPSKRPKIGFQDQLSVNVGQMNCRMIEREPSAILPIFIKVPIVIKIYVLSTFEWPFYMYTGFTVLIKEQCCC